MPFDTIIRNGTIVTATDTYASDVGIHSGQITAISKDLPVEAAGKIIDAAEKYVIPGGIDVHTHLDMPFGGTTSADDFESGTIAAAYGGTTTLIDFAIQYKGQTLHEAFDTWSRSVQRMCECKDPVDFVQTQQDWLCDAIRLAGFDMRPLAGDTAILTRKTTAGGDKTIGGPADDILKDA